MQQAIESDIVELALRALLATILLMAGSAKLVSRDSLSRDIDAYRLIPKRFAGSVGLSLASLELLLGVLLLTGTEVRAASLAVVCLFVTFLIATASAFVRKLNVECGCFGLLYRQKLGMNVATRDAALLVSSLYLTEYSAIRLTLPHLFDGQLDSGDIMVGLSLTSLLCVAKVTMSAQQFLRVARQHENMSSDRVIEASTS